MEQTNAVAEAYVQLVLALGVHDSDYVDAFYGPPEWRSLAESKDLSPQQIGAEAQNLLRSLSACKHEAVDELSRLRHAYLGKQLQAMMARVAMVAGERLSFEEEARQIYDAEIPKFSASHFRDILTELEVVLPGDGPLSQRFESFQKQFVIPKNKLDSVFQIALAEARRRTSGHIDLPEGESFTVEYVTDKPWSGYNWYKGGYHSLIQINTDLPIYIDRAVDLACHEGYPGHHVYNVLLEKHLVRDRGWVEFMVYPLFSPQSLIAEGTANFGIRVAFPSEERLVFEKETLFPAAGLDGRKAAAFYRVQDLAAKLSYAGNEAARAYLNGTMNRAQTISWLETYAMNARSRAEQRLRFIDKYRAYVINYNWGQDLVERYVIEQGGTDDRPQRRWQIFKELISSPRLPSNLKSD